MGPDNRGIYYIQPEVIVNPGVSLTFDFGEPLEESGWFIEFHLEAEIDVIRFGAEVIIATSGGQMDEDELPPIIVN